MTGANTAPSHRGSPAGSPLSHVAIVGAGWAGLAAAVRLVDLGHRVTVYEMASRPGGRARALEANDDGARLDNGQHILIGAYARTLALLERVGVRGHEVLERRPLVLVKPDGSGLRLPKGRPMTAFVRGVACASHWSVRDRIALLRTAAGWRSMGFMCGDHVSVSELTSALPAAVRRDLIDPLCVAALNTPAEEASGRVFLRILRDALFGGPGSADLLLPRVSLSALMPDAAVRALPSVTWHWRHRVASMAPSSDGTWRVDEATHDAVVLACTSVESSRLLQALEPAWSARAAALRFQSIVTVYAHHGRAALHAPMIALDSDATRPAQFVFDHGRLTGQAGLLALVVSGANEGLEREGSDALARRAIAQLADAMPDADWARDLSLVRVVTERRATFACTPALERPAAHVCEGVWAAADYVDGPYPATLEGAVRSGEAAASGIHAMAAPRPRPTPASTAAA